MFGARHNPADLRIVRAGYADAAALSDLAFRSKATNGYDDTFMAACRVELTYTAETISSGETWIATSARASGPMGFYDLRVEGDTAEVYAMFVDPQAKRCGIGSFLWEHLEHQAKILQACRIGLDADPFAEPFYRQMGLSIVGQSPSGSIAGRMLSRMEKELL